MPSCLVLGIEAVGVVAEAPGREFQEDEVVATCMCDLDHEVDGGCAEYTLIKGEHVRRLKAVLPWNVFGALPEVLQTVWGALNRNLDIM